MTALLTINVRNHEVATQNFYFFQEPGVYSSGQQVYSNCLFTRALGNYPNTGGILTFQVSTQTFAGIQQAHSTPQVGVASGFASASRAIDLAGSSRSSDDWTTASLSPLGLSHPVAGAGIPKGAFRISAPPFPLTDDYNIGTAVEINGGLALSSFVVARPNLDTDCQPVLKYYVQTGSYTPGSVMDFGRANINAAVCDFTGGHSVIDVTLNANGTWSVQIII